MPSNDIFKQWKKSKNLIEEGKIVRFKIMKQIVF